MANTVIIACETLRGEFEVVQKATGCDYPVIWIESGLHAVPKNLHQRMQREIDDLPAGVDTALLLFGFCGNSMVGLQSGRVRLVFPKVADCIPIFLGSQKKREEMGADAYFFTQGYLQGEQNMVTEDSYYVQRYGEKRAERLIKAMMQHYRKFVVIDTGAFAPQPVVDKVSPLAQKLGIPVNIEPGNLVLIHDLLCGNWDERYLVVPPGGNVRFEDSLNLGKAQGTA